DLLVLSQPGVMPDQIRGHEENRPTDFRKLPEEFPAFSQLFAEMTAQPITADDGARIADEVDELPSISRVVQESLRPTDAFGVVDEQSDPLRGARENGLVDMLDILGPEAFEDGPALEGAFTRFPAIFGETHALHFAQMQRAGVAAQHEGQVMRTCVGRRKNEKNGPIRVHAATPQAGASAGPANSTNHCGRTYRATAAVRTTRSPAAAASARNVAKLTCSPE